MNEGVVCERAYHCPFTFEYTLQINYHSQIKTLMKRSHQENSGFEERWSLVEYREVFEMREIYIKEEQIDDWTDVLILELNTHRIAEGGT